MFENRNFDFHCRRVTKTEKNAKTIVFTVPNASKGYPQIGTATFSPKRGRVDRESRVFVTSNGVERNPVDVRVALLSTSLMALGRLI